MITTYYYHYAYYHLRVRRGGLRRPRARGCLCMGIRLQFHRLYFQKTNGLLNKHIEFHPSGNTCFKTSSFFEIIVGETVVKSNPHMEDAAAQPRPRRRGHGACCYRVCHCYYYFHYYHYHYVTNISVNMITIIILISISIIIVFAPAAAARTGRRRRPVRPRAGRRARRARTGRGRAHPPLAMVWARCAVGGFGALGS